MTVSGSENSPKSYPEIISWKPKEAYKILFPRYPYEQLPKMRVSSSVQIPHEIMQQTYIEGGDLADAKERRVGYARRIDLPELDKFTVNALLSFHFIPFATVPKLSELTDILEPFEIIEGGIQQLFAGGNFKNIIQNPTAKGMRKTLANIYGISKKSDGQPKGLLIYLPGPRPPMEKKSVWIGIGKPQLKPSEVTVRP